VRASAKTRSRQNAGLFFSLPLVGEGPGEGLFFFGSARAVYRVVGDPIPQPRGSDSLASDPAKGEGSPRSLPAAKKSGRAAQQPSIPPPVMARGWAFSRSGFEAQPRQWAVCFCQCRGFAALDSEPSACRPAGLMSPSAELTGTGGQGAAIFLLGGADPRASRGSNGTSPIQIEKRGGTRFR